MRDFRDENERSVWCSAFSAHVAGVITKTIFDTSRGVGNGVYDAGRVADDAVAIADVALGLYRAKVPKVSAYRDAGGRAQLAEVPVNQFKKPDRVEQNLLRHVERATASAYALAGFAGQSEDDRRYYEAVHNTLEQLRKQL